MQSKDFVESLTGLGQHFKCSDSRHGKLVMPVSMVVSEKLDAAQRHEQKENRSNQSVSKEGTSVDARIRERAHAQFGDIQQVAQRREDEYLKGVLNLTSIMRSSLIPRLSPSFHSHTRDFYLRENLCSSVGGGELAWAALITCGH